MLNIERWKIILALVLSVLGVLYALPNALPQQQQTFLEEKMPSWLPSKTVNLGLDLRGGSHLLLQADTRKVISDRMDSLEDSVRSEMRKDSIGYTDLKTKRDGISFKLRDPAKDRDAARKIVRQVEQLSAIDVSDDGTVEVTLDESAINAIKKQVIGQSIEIVRRRIDETGTKEPVIQQQGADRIVVQLPGVDDPEYIKELLGRTAKMTFHLRDETALAAGPATRKLPMRESPGQDMIVKKRPSLTGDMLTDSQPGYDQQGPVVTMRFNATGTKKFCDLSRENTGKVFAIVLDDEIISAPYFREPICGGSGQISGKFTVKEASDLALLLRAGALPAPLQVVEERTVGPTLGSDSIAAGKYAAVVAFVLVFALMAATYGLFGLFANVALLLNIIFILSVLSMFQATLTLPGIAGIILTIGIAVDANVLIYERIREEIRQGRTVLSAVDTGYKLAWNTIIDSNLTTLIVALILFSFGSGPIKGFAVAMCVGIITSMFSAIMLTRLMVVTWLKRTKPSTLTL